MPQLVRAVEAETGRTLGPTLDKRFGPVRRALDGGSIVEFSAGTGSRYTTAGVLDITLLDLRNLAEAAVDPEKKNGPGRRAKHQASRRLTSISKGQWVGIRAVVNTIGAYLARPNETVDKALVRVDFRYFTWDAQARSGEGEWSRFLDLARTASEAKHGPRHSNLSNHLGSACLLLDLAASQGWIGHSPRHSDAFTAFPAEWAALHNHWRECLRQAKPGISHPAFVVRELLGACFVTEVHPSTANWSRIADYLEDRWRSNEVASTMRSNVRMGYRALQRVGLVPATFQWPSRRDRLSIVASKAISDIAAAYGANTNADVVPPRLEVPGKKRPQVTKRPSGPIWRAPDDRLWGDWKPDARGLVEGSYGLKRLLEYQCVPDSRTAKLYKLPPRGNFPREVIRPSNRQRNSEPWRAGTVETHLRRICSYAGWLEQNLGIDFSSSGSDLRVLLDEENIDAYSTAVTRGDVSTQGALHLLVISLARIASPYLEAVALREGDRELADRMARVAALLDSPKLIDGEESLASSLRESKQERAERIRAHAKKVEAVFTRDQQSFSHAYFAFVKVRTALVELAVRAAGGLSLNEQIDAVAGAKCFGRDWAWLIQAAQYQQDQLVAPLRTRAVCLQTVAMRSGGGDGTRGRFSARFPAKIMKSGRPFSVEYLSAANNLPGSPAFEIWDPRIYALHLAPGGAREILLTNGSGFRRKTDAFYVLDAAECRSEGPRWTPSALTNVRRRIFNATQELTGLPIAAELEAEGVLGNHSCRHGFGSLFAPRDLLFAARHLDHADIKTTIAYYCAPDASNMGGAATVQSLLQQPMTVQRADLEELVAR